MRAECIYRILAIMFVTLVAPISIGQAFVDERDPAQVEAVFKIEEIGGKVSGTPFSKPPRTFVELPVSASDSDLGRLKKLQGLRALKLQGPGIQDEGLAVLATLTEVEILVLNCPKVTDRGLQHLHALSRLQNLKIRCRQVSDDGIVALRKSLPACRVD